VQGVAVSAVRSRAALWLWFADTQLHNPRCSNLKEQAGRGGNIQVTMERLKLPCTDVA
jgi:hypothetical protein